VTFVGKSLVDWQHTPVPAPATNDVTGPPAWAGQGREQGTLMADPLFVDAAHNNFQLESNSPALKLGFRPFDAGQAGVYGDAAWVRLARSVNYPATGVAPPPQPLAK
jgi:hypothetical protein